jgi:FkbM family methyltransferase
MTIDEALKIIDATPLPELPQRDRNLPLYIYGKGKLGTLALDFFHAVNESIGGVFDWNNAAELDFDDGQVAVAISTAPYAPIAQKLKRYSNVVPFYDLAQTMRGDHPLSNGWIAPPLTEEDRKSIRCVWSEWSDDASRDHHLSFLAWRTIRQEWSFDGMTVNNADQHFIPEVVSILHDHEIFLDGGAYHGEASGKFFKHTNGKYRCIYAFEADDKNFEALVINKTINNIPMYVSPDALAREDGTMKFSDGFGFCSKLSDAGAARVTSRSIDSLNLAQTFIKLHLEGGELEALKGAHETLAKHRPIIAANVDHNTDGLWRTAAYLMGLLEDYRFLFRNHCWCASGAVVYAIPKERIK